MSFKIILLSTAVIFSVCSCVSGPKDPDRSFAEKLNGDNYKSTDMIMGVPVLERKPIQKKIYGKVFCGEGITQVPANHASVALTAKGRSLASVSTDVSGAYTVSTSIENHQSYELKASATCGKSAMSLPKDFPKDGVEINVYLK